MTDQTVPISLDLDACIYGWGPCLEAYGFSHNCKKRRGHEGLHICEWCGSRTKGTGPAITEGET